MPVYVDHRFTPFLFHSPCHLVIILGLLAQSATISSSLLLLHLNLPRFDDFLSSLFAVTLLLLMTSAGSQSLFMTLRFKQFGFLDISFLKENDIFSLPIMTISVFVLSF